MLKAKIEELIATLRKRIEGREQSIAAMKANPKHFIDPDASEAIDRAHIDELEYAIEKTRAITFVKKCERSLREGAPMYLKLMATEALSACDCRLFFVGSPPKVLQTYSTKVVADLTSPAMPPSVATEM